MSSDDISTKVDDRPLRFNRPISVNQRSCVWWHTIRLVSFGLFLMFFGLTMSIIGFVNDQDNSDIVAIHMREAARKNATMSDSSTEYNSKPSQKITLFSLWSIVNGVASDPASDKDVNDVGDQTTDVDSASANVKSSSDSRLDLVSSELASKVIYHYWMQPDPSQKPGMLREDKVNLTQLSLAGPIVMGIGAFLIVTSCVITFDSRENGSKISPSVLYNSCDERDSKKAKPNVQSTSSSQTTCLDRNIVFTLTSGAGDPSMDSLSARANLTDKMASKYRRWSLDALSKSEYGDSDPTLAALDEVGKQALCNALTNFAYKFDIDPYSYHNALIYDGRQTTEIANINHFARLLKNKPLLDSSASTARLPLSERKASFWTQVVPVNKMRMAKSNLRRKMQTLRLLNGEECGQQGDDTDAGRITSNQISRVRVGSPLSPEGASSGFGRGSETKSDSISIRPDSASLADRRQASKSSFKMLKRSATSRTIDPLMRPSSPANEDHTLLISSPYNRYLMAVESNRMVGRYRVVSPSFASPSS